MAERGVNVLMTVDVPSQAYGLNKTPTWSRSYSVPTLNSMPDIQRSGLRLVETDDGGGFIILEPQVSLVDMALDLFTFPNAGTGTYVPTSAYVISSDSSNGAKEIRQSTSTSGLQWEMDSVAAFAAGESFVCRVGRGQASTGAQSQGAANYACYLQIGDDTTPAHSPAGGRPARLWLQDGRAPFLQYGVPSGFGTDTWVFADYGENGVKAKTIADCSALIDATSRTFDIEWFNAPDLNLLMVTIAKKETIFLTTPQLTGQASGSSSLTFAKGDGFAVNPGRLKFYGANGQASFQVFPMRFTPTGTLTSGSQQLPFVWQGNAFLRGPGSSLPDGADVSYAVSNVPNAQGNQIQWSMEVTAPITGGGLASVSPVIPRIELYIPPTSYAGATITTPRVIDQRAMSEVVETDWLDVIATQNNGFALSRRQSVGIKFDTNYYKFPGGTNGRNWAVRLQRCLSDGSGNPLCPMWTFMDGWTGMDSGQSRSDPRNEFDLVIEDRTFPMRTIDEGEQPFGDAWCFLALIRYLAIASGMLDDFIGDIFKACAFGDNPAGCPHFKLPVGTVTNPRAGFSPTAQFWSSVTEIAAMVHAVIGFDSGNGDVGYPQLTIAPYYPTVLTNPSKGTITTSDDGDPNSPNFLMSFLSSMQTRISTLDVRTGVEIAGIDPSTNRLTASYFDSADLPGNEPLTGIPWADWGAQAHGMQQNLVSISTLNADPDYAAVIGRAALQKATMPTLHAQWDTPFHPHSFALDPYTLVEPATLGLIGGQGAFTVWHKESRYRCQGGPQSSSYDGLWLPNA